MVNWSNEEGARFNPPMLASAVFAGLRDIEWAWARTDNDSVTYGSALAAIGYVGDAGMGGRDIDAYFELHIEQGPILEAEGIAVGVVTHGYATRGMRLRITGETAHTGPTPMDQRRNALVGAAYLIAAVNDIGWKYHPEGGKSTASQIEIWPNAVGILPEFAQVSIDFPPPGSGGRRAHAGRCGDRNRRLRKARQRRLRDRGPLAFRRRALRIRPASSLCAMPPTCLESGTWTCRARPGTTPTT